MADEDKKPFLSALSDVTDKLTDVLNFGRVLSIGVPGAIAALPLLMMLSLVSTPLELTPAQRGTTETQERKVGEAAPDSATSDSVPTLQVTEQARDSASSVKTEYTGPLYVDSLPSFRLRIEQDIWRARDWWFLWLVGTVMMGSVISPLGYWLLRGVCVPLHRRGRNTDKESEFSWTNLHLPLLRTGSSDVTYHDHLVREYWRFTEFAANFPIALSIAAALGSVYVLLLGRSYSLPADTFTGPVAGWLAGIAAALVVLYLLWWLPFVVYESFKKYQKAGEGLVAGVMLLGTPAEIRKVLLDADDLEKIKEAYVRRFMERFGIKPPQKGS